VEALRSHQRIAPGRLKRSRRLRDSAISFGASLLATATTASYAGVASGSRYGPYSVGGYSYKNVATISTSSTLDQGRVKVQVQSGSAPTGWMGTEPRAFRYSTGALACQGPVTYSASVAVSLETGCAFTAATGVGYYANGFTHGWNGSTYKRWGSYNSPNQNG